MASSAITSPASAHRPDYPPSLPAWMSTIQFEITTFFGAQVILQGMDGREIGHVSTDTPLQEVIRSYDGPKVSRNLQILPSCIIRYMKETAERGKIQLKKFSF